MKFNVLSVAKFAVSAVVGVGTSKIVKDVIKTHSTPETLIDKVTITAAAWVIAGIATERTKKYADKTVDDVADAATELINTFKLNAKLSRINRNQSTFEDEGLVESDFEKDPKTGNWVPTQSYKDKNDARKARLLETLNNSGLSGYTNLRCDPVTNEWEFVKSEYGTTVKN